MGGMAVARCRAALTLKASAGERGCDQPGPGRVGLAGQRFGNRVELSSPLYTVCFGGEIEMAAGRRPLDEAPAGTHACFEGETACFVRPYQP